MPRAHKAVLGTLTFIIHPETSPEAVAALFGVSARTAYRWKRLAREIVSSQRNAL